MTKYVFEMYGCESGNADVKTFDTECDALEYAESVWWNLSSIEEDEYKDPHSIFMVYDIMISEENYKKYTDGTHDFCIGDFCNEIVKDFAERW